MNKKSFIFTFAKLIEKNFFMTFLLLSTSTTKKKSIRLERKRNLVVKMQLYSTRAISVKFSSQDFKQKKRQNGFLLQILISHQISMEINVKHFHEILHVLLLPRVMYIHSFIFLTILRHLERSIRVPWIVVGVWKLTWLLQL